MNQNINDGPKRLIPIGVKFIKMNKFCKKNILAFATMLHRNTVLLWEDILISESCFCSRHKELCLDFATGI
jgi:hypothetical protein